MLGYPPREWLERHDLWIAMVHPDDRDRVMRQAAEAFAAGQEEGTAFRCLSRDGKVVDVELRAAVIRDAFGKAVGMRGFMMDVSDRRRAEEKLRRTEEQLRQAQKMEAIGRLAGGVAHDFNNLLTAVNGYSDLMLAGMDEEHPMREFAGEIRAAGGRGTALTRQLLAFSRQEVVEPRIVDVNEVVCDIKLLLGRLIGEDIRLRISLEPDLFKVKVDPNQVGQILINLAVNGRDAMQQRGGSLDIETANVSNSGEDSGFYIKPKPGPCVRLTMRDSGTGMAAEVMEHIFEPFFTTKDQQRGTGLGLSTVFGILESMGGGIRVDSAPGSGSAFHIYIPALLGEAESGYDGHPQGEVLAASVGQ
jgi:two-component system, cell cycle sensor histidine kinase and response regulator CckA